MFELFWAVFRLFQPFPIQNDTKKLFANLESSGILRRLRSWYSLLESLTRLGVGTLSHYCCQLSFLTVWTTFLAFFRGKICSKTLSISLFSSKFRLKRGIDSSLKKLSPVLLLGQSAHYRQQTVDLTMRKVLFGK